jgi:hypothetical protein
LISVPGHDTEQTPPPHAWPDAQTIPALPPLAPQPSVAPQWPASVIGSTQLRLHATCPAAQVVVHWLLEHTCPAGHALPHIPQFPTSEASVTHEPEQTLWPIGQPVAHAPPTQASATPQTLPHAPQLSWDEVRS